MLTETLRFSFCPLLSKSSTYLADHFIRPLLLLEDELSREVFSSLFLYVNFPMLLNLAGRCSQACGFLRGNGGQKYVTDEGLHFTGLSSLSFRI